MMLAQTAPDPHSFSQFWIIIAFIAAVGANLVTIVVLVSNRKQKREVSFGFEPASKTEFEKHADWNRREHENLFAKIGGVERGANQRCDMHTREFREILDVKLTELMNANNVGREKLHDRINEVLEAVAELRGRVEERVR